LKIKEDAQRNGIGPHPGQIQFIHGKHNMKKVSTGIAKFLYGWETSYRLLVYESVDFCGGIGNIHTQYMMASFASEVSSQSRERHL
jgi:hypothetical protein